MLFRAKLALGTFLSTLALGAVLMPSVEAKVAEKKATASEKKLARIEGFRSAKFGMSKKAIYKAIARDFKISKSKVKSNVHSLEKTTSLEVTVPKLIGVGGVAKIGYVFGYKSKKLMQVNVVWGRGATEKVDGQDVVDAANFLRNHLIKKKYQKEGFVANARMNDVMTIVFRGKDKKGRMALLVLTLPKAKKDEDAKKAADKISLKLSYIADTVNPDVLTIGEGDF